MIIKLHFKGPLKKYAGNEEFVEVNLETLPCTLAELLQQFNVPASAVSFITVNEQKKAFDTTLNGGEVVVVYPRVAGG